MMPDLFEWNMSNKPKCFLVRVCSCGGKSGYIVDNVVYCAKCGKISKGGKPFAHS